MLIHDLGDLGYPHDETTSINHGDFLTAGIPLIRPVSRRWWPLQAGLSVRAMEGDIRGGGPELGVPENGWFIGENPIKNG